MSATRRPAARVARLLIAAAVPAAPLLLSASAASAQSFGVSIRVDVPPPPLPVYDQPPIPGPDYVWTPGYWAWDDDVEDYYWIPGTWVLAPQPGYYWTPPWWGYEGGYYAFHSGYWAPQVGYYGGINYGFGYFGSGFDGGYWSGPHFYYNRVVLNVVNVTRVYDRPVFVNNVRIVNYNDYRRRLSDTRFYQRYAYNGPGGIDVRPRPGWDARPRLARFDLTADQRAHYEAARRDRELFAGANRGAPPIAATPAAARFGAPGIARGYTDGRTQHRYGRFGSDGRGDGARPAIADGPRAQGFDGRPADRDGRADGSDARGSYGRPGGDPRGDGRSAPGADGGQRYRDRSFDGAQAQPGSAQPGRDFYGRGRFGGDRSRDPAAGAGLNAPPVVQPGTASPPRDPAAQGFYGGRRGYYGDRTPMGDQPQRAPGDRQLRDRAERMVPQPESVPQAQAPSGFYGGRRDPGAPRSFDGGQRGGGFNASAAPGGGFAPRAVAAPPSPPRAPEMQRAPEQPRPQPTPHPREGRNPNERPQ
ncbi:MAG: hypothetical protein RQ833_10630 [Sphingomonadaceae bacterium]|nr:hypothetical protein [Sphingomonadaceae bacterium]